MHLFYVSKSPWFVMDFLQCRHYPTIHHTMTFVKISQKVGYSFLAKGLYYTLLPDVLSLLYYQFVTYTVEPRLTNTLVRRTPHLNEQFWSVPDIFPVKSCLKTSPWANNLALPAERTAVCPPKVSVSEVFTLPCQSVTCRALHQKQLIRDSKSWYEHDESRECKLSSSTTSECASYTVLQTVITVFVTRLSS